MSQFFSKIFLWMFIGLAITFCTGAIIANSPTALETIFTTGGIVTLSIVEIITVIVLSARLHKMSEIGAKLGFIFYSFISGLTFSSIFVVYEIESIMFVFLLASFIFLILSLIGFFTKADITKLGTILLVSLIALLVLEIVNIFVLSSSLNFGLCILGIVIFMGYVCYDVYKLKGYYSTTSNQNNMAIYGALELYLDFINLFLHLLRLLGKAKD